MTVPLHITRGQMAVDKVTNDTNIIQRASAQLRVMYNPFVSLVINTSAPWRLPIFSYGAGHLKQKRYLMLSAQRLFGLSFVVRCGPPFLGRSDGEMATLEAAAQARASILSLTEICCVAM